MPKQPRRTKVRRFSDTIPVERLLPEGRRNDLQELRDDLDAFRPELDALAEFFERNEQRFRVPTPDSYGKEWRRVEALVRRQARSLRKELSRQKGSPVTAAEMDTLIKIGLQRARPAFALTLSDSPNFDLLAGVNLVAEGTYRIAGDRLAWQAPGEPPIVFNTSDAEDTETAEVILIASIALEAIGFVFALAGFFLPKVDVVAIANRFFKTRSRLVRRQVQAMLRILMDGQKTLLEKLEAIATFLNSLATLGILSDIVAQIFADLSWWRIGLLIIQFLAQIAALLVPGLREALLVSKGVAIANAVLALVQKGRDLGDLLKKKQA